MADQYNSIHEMLNHHHRAIYRAQRLAEIAAGMAFTGLLIMVIFVAAAVLK